MSAQEILKTAVGVARAAGQLVNDHFGTSLEVTHKGLVDLVTRADRASEHLIIETILSRFPEHGILAEEGGALGNGQSGILWVVDPLDGTTNFAHGLPIYTISIGVMEKGVPRVGVVYDPTRDEMFTAVRGAGAHCNDEPIHVSGVESLNQALLVTGFPYDVRTSRANNLDHFENFMKRSRAVRRLGSAALDLCYVACGRFDGFWELKLHPWDVAAGALLVEEAGGVVTRFQGEAFAIESDEIVAAGPALAARMYEVLAQGLRPQEENRLPSA